METPRGLMMRALLGEAADEARVGIIVYDENGSYIAANRTMCALLGYELEELLALTPLQVSARPAKVVSNTLAAIVKHGTHSGATKLRRKDGTRVSGRYVAARTTIAHIEYYVSFFEPKR